jgi:tetratricopeptide (TPR) repeat protein
LREESTARADEALTRARGIGDDALIGKALAARAGAEPEHPDCARRVRAAVPSLVRADEIKYALLLLVDIWYAALADGRLDEARELLEDAVPLADGAGSATAAFNVHDSIAIAYLLLGHDAAAAHGLRRALEAARAADFEEIDEAPCGLAALAARRGELEQAARLAGAGRAHAPATLTPSDRRVDEIVRTTYLAPARQHLGAHHWDQHAREGARLGRLAAIDLGLAMTRRWSSLDDDLTRSPATAAS